MSGVGFKLSDFVEGGAVPVEKNLTWKEARFNKFDYTKKDGTVVASTCALRVIYVDDDGTETEQQYSAADLARVVIKNVVIVKQHTNPINEHSETTYGANLDSTKQYNKIAGKVQVTSTRGGCFINSLKF